MPSGDLYKLDHLSASRSDRGAAADWSASGHDMLSEAPRAFHPYPLPHTAAQPVSPAELRRDHAAGRLDDRTLTDRLARITGTPRVHFSLTPPDPDLAGLLDPAFCLRHQCLPWKGDGGRLWIATAWPEHFPALRDEIAARTGRDPARLRPVVAPRDDIQAHLAARHRPELSLRMRTRVPLHLSCRAWSAQSARRALFVLVILGALSTTALAAPAALLTGLITLALATMVIAATFKTTAALAHLLRPAQSPAPREVTEADLLPAISVLVPLFREKEIASTLIKRLKRLDYPREKLEILLVLEETDDLTRAVLSATPLPPWMRVITVPDGAPRTKPRAMNYALDFCQGDIVGVYDAEDAPDPDQLLRVAAMFDAAPPDVVCLQGVLDYYNPRASWIARCFTIEYNTWFRLLLPGMSRLGFALPLGGTTLFFRRPQLEEIGAWDAHNVTEDADLGFRLARAGYRTRTFDSTTGEEANHRPLPWIRQRSRWLKGYLATYLVHMRAPWRLYQELGGWQFLGFQAHFLTALTQFTLAPLLWIFWLVSFGFDLPFTTIDADPRVKTLVLAFLGQEALTMILGIIATRRAGHRRLWAWVPLMHLYWPLGAVAMWKALHELVVRPFYWDKTDHGHSLAPGGSADRADGPGIELEAGHEGAGDMLPQPLTGRVLVPRLDRADNGVMF